METEAQTMSQTTGIINGARRSAAWSGSTSAQKRQHFHRLGACARPRASRLRKSKAVAGGQGRTVGDRSADPVREKCPDPHGCRVKGGPCTEPQTLLNSPGRFE